MRIKRNPKNNPSKERESALKIFKQTVKEAANPVVSRFQNWDTENLKALLVENNVQIRGSANASHSTLVRICDEVFGPVDDGDGGDDSGLGEGDGEGCSGGDNSSALNTNNDGISRSESMRTATARINLNSSFSFGDLAKMNWAAMKIQRMFIASRQRMYERMFSNQQQYDTYNEGPYEEEQHHQFNEEQRQHQQEYYDDGQNYVYNEYYDNVEAPKPSAPHLEGVLVGHQQLEYTYEEYHPSSAEEFSNGQYQKEDFDDERVIDDALYVDENLNGNSGEEADLVPQNEIEQGSFEEDDDDLDEELDVEWRKPSWKYAKKYEAENRPHKAGKDMKKYDWKHVTLGRHCTMGGCGEQLDLWDEGAISEFSQFGSGITNYFKVNALKICDCR